MTYKTILIHVDGTLSMPARTQVAANIAKRHDAHLIGIAPAGVAFVPGDAYLGVAAEMITKLQSELDTAASVAAKQFESSSQEIGVESVESWAIGSATVDSTLVHARLSDLIVIGQAETTSQPGGTSQGFVEKMVLGAGKPVVVVPNTGHCNDAGKRVVVAWDGGRESARAAADAVPLLAQADAVEVLVVTNKSARDENQPVPGSGIALHLARHGVKVEVRNLHTDIDIGETILSHVADFGADLLVMGAYGHSRVREWVLGGATRTVLDSMTVPVLMSH